MPIPSRILRGTRRDYTIDYLTQHVGAELAPGERRLLGMVLPPWQRAEVWSEAQKRRFVEGIFLGFGCGYYVINGLDWDAGGRRPMAGWLLDGQQRISALRDFFEDRLVVFGDVLFSSLSEPQVLRFRREQFPCFELEYTADENQLKELYDRLNFGGTAHTREERVVPQQANRS